MTNGDRTMSIGPESPIELRREDDPLWEQIEIFLAMYQSAKDADERLHDGVGRGVSGHLTQ